MMPNIYKYKGWGRDSVRDVKIVHENCRYFDIFQKGTPRWTSFFFWLFLWCFSFCRMRLFIWDASPSATVGHNCCVDFVPVLK